MKIVAISGSLRSGSSNAALLRAGAALAPEGMELVFYEGVGSLPHFNPDLDGGEPPRSVREFRALLGAADGVLISSPEYAHGIPGSLEERAGLGGLERGAVRQTRRAGQRVAERR